MNHDNPNPAKHLSFAGLLAVEFRGVRAAGPGVVGPLRVGPPARGVSTASRASGNSRDEDCDAAFVLPAGVFFVLASVVMFATWDWDNTKLMIWCYLAFLPFLWRRWLRGLAAPVRWPVCAVLFFSGAVCLAGGLGKQHIGYGLIQRAELDGVVVATDRPAGGGPVRGGTGLQSSAGVLRAHAGDGLRRPSFQPKHRLQKSYPINSTR